MGAGLQRQAKFYTDENVDRRLPEILRELGLDVVTAADAGLIHRDDSDHLAFAQRENRILVTNDKDFLYDRRHPPNRCPGLVVIDVGAQTRDSVEPMVWLLTRVVAPYREIWRHSKVLIMRDYQMTVWMRQHSTGKRMKSRYRLSGRDAEEWISDADA